jgi:hypothetical protein
MEVMGDNPIICGPVAVANATGSPLATVLDRWPSPFRGNDDDSPWHHYAALTRLGWTHKPLTVDALLARVGDPGVKRVVVLLHRADDPIMSQHWVTVESVEPGAVRVWWGDGTVRVIPAAALHRDVNAAWPNVIYEAVPVGEAWKAKPWTRLWLWLTRWF